MTTKLTIPDRARALLAKIQECENECYAIGFTGASHKINEAKNAVGWDLRAPYEMDYFSTRARTLSPPARKMEGERDGCFCRKNKGSS